MVNLGMILAAVLGLGGLLFLTTAKKEGVSVGAEIGELGKGIGELGLGAGRGIAGAIGTPAFTLIEALRGIFQLGADIQGIPRRDDRAGARPGDEIRTGPALPPPYRPPAAEPFSSDPFNVGSLVFPIAGPHAGILGEVIQELRRDSIPQYFVRGVTSFYSQDYSPAEVRAGARA